MNPWNEPGITFDIKMPSGQVRRLAVPVWAIIGIFALLVMIFFAWLASAIR